LKFLKEELRTRSLLSGDIRAEVSEEKGDTQKPQGDLVTVEQETD
jgi:hypothetical protein